jgi:O-antigen ligase
MCAIAMIMIRREHVQQHRWVIVIFMAITALAILHVIPMPPALWQTLPGWDEVATITRLTGLADVWRPLTLTPMNGLHALASLATPLAVLLLGFQLSKDDLYRLLPLLIGLSALSGLFGLLQVIGSREGPIYFYQITNLGSAVGLFANRNHAATLLACLFPMLAIFATTAKGTTDQQNSRQLLAVGVAIILVPLILVTGSRSGLISAIIGLIGAALLYRRPAAGRTVRKGGNPIRVGAIPLLAGLAVLCLGFLTFYFSRAEAIDRLFADASVQDNRSDFWIVSLDLFWKYFPLGSGSGSFVEAYQIAEPAQLLNATYLNRAHNDWLEIAVTFGLPGLLLLAIAIFGYFRQSFIIWRRMDGKRRSVMFARMAGIAMAIVAIASMADYPLRTPTMMCVFAIFTLWFAGATHKAIPPVQTSGREV